jgi:ankyrin repeat protein
MAELNENLHDNLQLEAAAVLQNGSTPLHWAVKKDNLEMLELLLGAGVPVDATNKVREPPLLGRALQKHGSALT